MVVTYDPYQIKVTESILVATKSKNELKDVNQDIRRIIDTAGKCDIEGLTYHIEKFTINKEKLLDKISKSDVSNYMKDPVLKEVYTKEKVLRTELIPQEVKRSCRRKKAKRKIKR